MVIIDNLYENCAIWDPKHSSEEGGGGGTEDLRVGVKNSI